MTAISRSIWAILFKKDFDYAELLTVMANLLFALVQGVFKPIEALPRNYAFITRAGEGIGLLAEETRWVLVLLFLTTGLIQLWALARMNWSWRRHMAMIGALIWAFLFMGLVLGEYKSIAPYLCLLIAFSEGWAYLRLRVL